MISARGCRSESAPMRIGTAWSFFAQLLSQSGQTSGVTSKPAIEGHFKTGQRTSTLDDLVLPYQAAVWQAHCLAPMPILQNDIPVLPFLRREVRFENQVAPFRSARHVHHEFANLFH